MKWLYNGHIADIRWQTKMANKLKPKSSSVSNRWYSSGRLCTHVLLECRSEGMVRLRNMACAAGVCFDDVGKVLSHSWDAAVFTECSLMLDVLDKEIEKYWQRKG